MLIDNMMKKNELAARLDEDLSVIENFRALVCEVTGECGMDITEQKGFTDIELATDVSLRICCDGGLYLIDRGESTECLTLEEAEDLILEAYLLRGGLDEAARIVQEIKKTKVYEFHEYGTITVMPGAYEARFLINREV